MLSTRLLTALAIVGLAFLTYANILGAPFFYDDHLIIEGSRFLNGPAPPWEAFRLDFFNLGDREFTSGFYRPLPMLVFKLTVMLFGPNPGPFHATSLALHIGCCLLVWQLGRRLFAAQGAALAAALLFAVHPIHSEAVDWACSSGDLLACALGLAALYLWRAPPYSLGAPALLLLAMLCKENSLLLGVFAASVAGLASRGRGGIRPVAGAPGMLAVSLGTVLALLGYLALRLGYAGVDFHQAASAHPALAERLARSAELLVRYLGLMVWPLDLNLQRWTTVAEAPNPLWLALCWLLLTLYAAAMLAALRRGRPEGTCLWFLVLTLGPVLNLVALPQPLAERSAYLPSVGFCWLVGLLGTRLPRRAALAALAGLVLVGAALTSARGVQWNSEVELWRQTIRLSPRSLDPYLSLAQVCTDQGAFGEAASLYRSVIQAAPRQASGYLGLAQVARAQRRPEQALTVLQEGLQAGVEPPAPVQVSLGHLLLDLGRPQAALSVLQDAQLDDEGRFYLALALAQVHRYEEAEQVLWQLLEGNPRHGEAAYNLPVFYLQAAQYAEERQDWPRARAQLQEFLRLFPGHPARPQAEAWLNRLPASSQRR